MFESFEIVKIGHEVPNFELEAVMPNGEGLDRFGVVSLAEIKDKGKWTVLYFYPTDFTFVCPTEIKTFDSLNDKFEALNATLIAVSTDSVFAHLAWQTEQLGKLNHIHASDRTQMVSDMFGVLDETQGLAWRGTFIIDPQGVLKHMSINHGEGGRNVEEVLRTLEVFINEAQGKLVPCGWSPGMNFLEKK